MYLLLIIIIFLKVLRLARTSNYLHRMTFLMCVNSLIEVLSIEVINELLMPTLLRHNFELNHYEK